MKVILTQDVPQLGRRGAVVEVADGYGRNYLLPRGLALPAAEGLLEDLEAQAKAAAAKEKRLAERARAQAAALAGRELVIRARAGEGGKLFGAVTSKEIAAALAREFQVQVDKRKVELDGPIKLVGSYPVTIRLHPQVTATVTVRVTGEGERS
ncbi:MAG: 50S ribosomal protein L9 [Clostridia bacterium]|nr:50S ribosomal protein L9 [Clostridia bacterium]MBC7346867.1 50S ribosomal protein L9 [Clostridia bacterium]